MTKNHTKYKDLPNCLKCNHCEMSNHIPCRTVTGHYGFFYSIYCKNEKVTKYINDYGGIDRSFWYDPNRQEVWVDAGSAVKNDCGHFDPAFYSDPVDFEED